MARNDCGFDRHTAVTHWKTRQPRKTGHRRVGPRSVSIHRSPLGGERATSLARTESRGPPTLLFGDSEIVLPIARSPMTAATVPTSPPTLLHGLGSASFLLDETIIAPLVTLAPTLVWRVRLRPLSTCHHKQMQEHRRAFGGAAPNKQIVASHATRPTIGTPALLEARSTRDRFLAHLRTSDRGATPGIEANFASDVFRDFVQAYCGSTDQHLNHPGIDHMAGAHAAEKERRRGQVVLRIVQRTP
jgi:hypothetical protein